MEIHGIRWGGMFAQRLPDRSPRNTMPRHGDAALPGGEGGGMPDTHRTLSVSVQKWLLVLVFCGVAGIVILAVYGKWQVERIYDSASYANANTVPRIVAIDDARAHFARLRLALYRRVMDSEHALLDEGESIARERAAMRLALDRYESMVSGVEERHSLDIVRALLAEYERDTLAAEELILASYPDLALQVLIAQAGAADRIIHALDSQVASNVSQGREEDAHAMRTFSQASWATLAFVLTVVSILLAVGYVIGRRIAEQVDRIRALARDNEIFRAMVECVRDQPVTVHEVDGGHCIVYANAAACRHFGADLETLLTWTPIEFDPHASPAMLQKLTAEWRRHGSSMFESEHRIASGELIPVEVASSFFEHDGRRLAICFTRDLRPRLEAEARMLEMERVETEREGMHRLARFAQNAPGFIYSLEMRDDRLAMTYVSPAVEDVFGLSEEEALTDIANRDALILPEDLAKLYAAMKISADDLAPFHLEWRIRHPAKGLRWIEARSMPERMDDGAVVWHGFMHDITERKQAERHLEETGARLLSVLQTMPDLVWLKDTAGGYLACNHAFERLFGAGEADIVGRTDYDFVDTGMAEVFRKKDEEAMAAGHIRINEEWVTFAEDGRRVLLETRKVPVHGADGRVIGILGIGRDITERNAMTEALAKRERDFRTLVEHSPDTICRYNPDCRRVYANPKMIEDFRVPTERLLGKTPTEFPGGEYAQTYQQRIAQVVASGLPADFELHWSNVEGKQFCSHVRLTPEFDREGGSVTGVLAVGRDITEIDEYRRRVHRMAFYDALTNLPNRSLLNDRIGQTIADAAYHGHRFGLMILDLDGFKAVNDTLGHGVGDLLLREVGNRLLGCVRIYDTVARLGGDEFAVLLPEVRADGNLAVVARKILDALAEPFIIGGKEMFISASIGIALYPSDSADIDGLFRYADSAMYHAKKQGRNNFQFYSAELTARSGERMALESALRRARKKQELELYYQPQVDTLSGRLVGAEALLRWNRGTHGMVTPDRFIPIAEETGLIVDIGEWVLETACEAAVAWNTGRKVPLKVAVNLSSRQFLRNDLAKTIRTVMGSSGCKPEWLGLEITESLLLDDAEDIQRTLAEFDAMGLSIAIDDFGTGYSALGYLNRFPVSVLKIDRSFVRDMTTDRDRAELVKAIISMARSLRMELVAEGVETDAQAAYLGNLGCHVAQGYLFGKPMPRLEFEVLLNEGSGTLII